MDRASWSWMDGAARIRERAGPRPSTTTAEARPSRGGEVSCCEMELDHVGSTRGNRWFDVHSGQRAVPDWLFGRLTFFHAAPRIAPLITNTVPCLCPPFSPPLSISLPSSFPPSLSGPRSLNLLYPRAESARSSAPHPSLLRRFRRTCPSRSSDSITCPPPPPSQREVLKKFCIDVDSRVTRVEGMRVV